MAQSSGINEGPESYLSNLASISQNNRVRVTKDIWNSQGVLLVAKGQTISNDNVERIIQYKLVQSIEDSIALENALSGEGIAKLLLEQNPKEPCLNSIKSNPEFIALIQELAGILKSYPTILQKLTVLKTLFPNMFEKALFTCLLGVAIASHASLEKHTLVNIFIASLSHDLGLLHIDPKIVNKSIPKTAETERAYSSHPVIMASILQRTPNVHSEVIAAVLEHEEAPDGSGYPRSLTANKLGYIGQMLSLTDHLYKTYTQKLKPKSYLITDYLQPLQFEYNHFIPAVWRHSVLFLRSLPKREEKVIPATAIKQQLETMLHDLNGLNQRFLSLYGLIASLPHQDDMPLNRLANIKAARLRWSMASSGLLMEAQQQWLENQINAYDPNQHFEIETSALIQQRCNIELHQLTALLMQIVEEYEVLDPNLIQLVQNEMNAAQYDFSAG